MSTQKKRISTPQLDARRLASGIAMSLGRSPFERGTRRLATALSKNLSIEPQQAKIFLPAAPEIAVTLRSRAKLKLAR